MVAKRRLRGAEPFGAPPAPPLVCPLCGRPIVPGPSADEHHLVPRSQGGRDKMPVHRVCHRKIHATFSAKELACGFASWEALRAHPEIAAFVRWVRGKPPEFDAGSRRPRSS